MPEPRSWKRLQAGAEGGFSHPPGGQKEEQQVLGWAEIGEVGVTGAAVPGRAAQGQPFHAGHEMLRLQEGKGTAVKFPLPRTPHGGSGVHIGAARLEKAMKILKNFPPTPPAAPSGTPAEGGDRAERAEGGRGDPAVPYSHPKPWARPQPPWDRAALPLNPAHPHEEQRHGRAGVGGAGSLSSSVPQFPFPLLP